MTFLLLIVFDVKLTTHLKYPDNILICDIDIFKYYELTDWDQNTKQDPKN